MEQSAEPNWVALHDHAWAAVEPYVVESLFFLVPREENKPAPWVGSGTLYRTPQGRLLGVTAAHNVDEARPYSIGMSGFLDAFHDVVKEVITCPEADTDVAILVLRGGLELIAPRACSPDSVVHATDAEVTAQDWTVVAGYPAQYVASQNAQIRGTDRKFRLQTFSPVIFGCRVDGKDPRGRFQIAWGEATRAPGSAHFSHADHQATSPSTLPNPHGISGGALWRFRSAGSGEIWSPQANGKIVGVPVSWDQTGVEFAESTMKWAEWMREVARDLDR